MDGQAAPRLSRLLPVLSPMLFRLGLAIAVSPALVAAAATETEGASGREWKGTREVRDGVTYVWNPAEPLEGTVEYELRELWRLESERADGTVVFGVVEDVAEDTEGNVLVLDSQLCRVHRVSASGAYLGSIGREGDGPGEFRHPSSVFVTNNGRIGVIDSQVASVVFLDSAGEPQGKWTLNIEETSQDGLISILPLRNGYVAHVVSRNFTREQMETAFAAHLFSLEGRQERQIVSRTHVLDRSRMYDYIEEEEDALWIQDASMSGRILISLSFRDYRLHVYDDAGELQMVVEMDYESLGRTADEIAAERSYREGSLRDYPTAEVHVSPFHRTVASAKLQDNGDIHVTSSRGWKEVREGVVEKVDVFNSDGVLVRRIVVLGRVLPENDIVLPLGNRRIIAHGGAGAQMAAVGAGGHALTDGSPASHPFVACYELVAAGCGRMNR